MQITSQASHLSLFKNAIILDYFVLTKKNNLVALATSLQAPPWTLALLIRQNSISTFVHTREFREPAVPVITMSSGMITISRPMSYNNSPSSFATLMFVALGQFRFLPRPTTLTWWPSVPAIIWLKKNTIQVKAPMFLVDPRIEPLLPWLELLPFTLMPVKSCTLLKKAKFCYKKPNFA